MNTLWNNALAGFHGPYFAILFAAVSVAGLIVGGVWIWLCDSTRDLELPDDPANDQDDPLSPYDVAYLRGGPAGIVPVVVVDLLLRGLIERHKPANRFGLFPRRMRLRHYHAAADAAQSDAAQLTSLQRAAWAWFPTPRLPRAVFHPKTGLITAIAPLCEPFAMSLEQGRLLETSHHKTARRVVGWVMSLSLLSVGLCKLALAAMMQHGELFPLIALMTAGLISTAIVCRKTRLSNLGQRLLESMCSEFDADEAEAAPSGQQRFTLPRSSVSVLHRVALFGVAAVHEFLAGPSNERAPDDTSDRDTGPNPDDESNVNELALMSEVPH